MDRICLHIAYNGKWTTNYKYLDHDTKLVLVNDEITFEGLVEKIFHSIKLKRGDTEANIWFDTKLETSKGMLVTNDEEVTTCIYLLKNHPNFKVSRFIVDLAERNSLSAKSSNTELCIVHEVNIVQQEEGVREMDIERREGLIFVEPTTELEFLTPLNVKKERKRPRSKRNDLPIVILRENASLDEIVKGSMFEDKQSLKKCFSNNATKYNFQLKVRKSSKTTYWLKCYDKECSWYMRASKFRDSALFKINKFEKNHSCFLDESESDQRHVTPKVISNHIIELLRDNKVKIRPKFVVEEIRSKYGLSIGYHKAWRSIQRARAVIRGRPEENYELPPGCNSLDELPPGWKKEVVIHQNDRRIRKEPFYTDPVHGYVFRTKKEVFRYLQSGDTSRCVRRRHAKKILASSMKDLSMLHSGEDESDAVQLPEGLPPFIYIDQNELLGRKHKKLKEEDIAICECKLDASDPESACGERCLNVLTNTECTLGYCHCGSSCRNRRFQRREYAKTKLFRTEGKRGWGLLADENIKAGQFIIEYCGEVISSEEAKTRSQTYEAHGLKDAYIISLDANYFIDATQKGSIARFINHSCQPNCETRKWTVLGETRVGIFAKQDILAGTELAYDYNFEWYGGATVRCLCGASNCCMFLGAKSQLFLEYNHAWEDEDGYIEEGVPLYDSEGETWHV